MSAARAGAFVVATVACVSVLSAQSAQQPAPTFRSTTDLVAVDVNVIDGQGRPIVDLTPADFTIKVDGKPRTVRSAEFVSLRHLGGDRESPAVTSTGAPRRPGRLIMLVIDQGHITKGTGKEAFRAAARFVDALTPADRVAIQIIPGSGPIPDFTADHAAVKAVLDRAVGQAIEADRSGRVGIAEAIAVSEQDDEYAWQGILERECVGFHDQTSLLDCRNRLGAEVRDVFVQTVTNTRMSLLSLRTIVERLALTPEPKTLVLISEGIVLDEQMSDVSWIAPRTAAANVSIYGIRLSSPQYIVTMGRTSPTREKDQQLMIQGLDHLAGLGRGSIYSVAVNANATFSRLSLELSGYYLLSFEPITGDRDGRNHEIAVGVTRRGATVRARRQFSAQPAGSLKANSELLAETLRSTIDVSDFPLDVTTFTYLDETTGRLKVIIGADAAIDTTQPPSLGYVITDATGRPVALEVEPAVTTSKSSDDSRQMYVGATLLDPGAHRIRLAVVDAAGRRASVERPIDARLTPVGQIRIGELMLARPPAGTEKMRPSIDGRFVTDALLGYTELYSEAEPQLQNASMRLEIASSEDGRAIEGTAMTFAQSRQGKRAAQGFVPLALLSPGRYVARAVLSVGGRVVGRVTRPFQVERASASTPETTGASAAPVAEIPFRSSLHAFDRADVLTRPVLAFFIERMHVAGAAPVPDALKPAIGFARMARFAEVRRIVASAPEPHPARSFLAGLGELAAGELASSASHFAAAVKDSPEMFPALFYLGAAYAAAGQDREAVRVWRTSLVTDPAAPWIHTLLADALLRQREYAQAVELLRDANRVWPGNDDVQMRWGTALAETGQGAVALKVLGPYLERHPADADRLLLSMRLLFEARTAGRPIASVDADRALFVKYFDLYVAANGSEIERARQWRSVIER